jgi:flagellar basal-body rod modification protein FlgD
MATTSAVSPLFTSLNPPSLAASSSNAPPGQADFLKLLMAQMQNQNPLNPVSGTDFTTQLAQFSTLQGIQQLNANFSNMLALQGLTQGANLIGKTVTYTTPGSTSTSQGVVQSVNLVGGNVQIVVSGNTVGLAQVQSVTAGPSIK